MPSLGRIVIIHGIHSNGTDDHPAIITYVWGREVDPTVWCCNLTIFPDFGDPRPLTSINLFPTKDAALAWRSKQTVNPVVAYWPPRT